MNNSRGASRIYKIVQFSLMILGGGVVLAAPADTSTEGILAQVLQVWSLINVARSVAKQDLLAFHDALFNATLELYGRLRCAVQHGADEVDVAVLDQALHGISRSHSGLYRDCAEAALLGAPRLMRSIGTLWEGYKERVSYCPEHEDMIGTLIERLI